MPGGDGRLNHDLLPDEKGPQDACGVFGVWAPGEEVANLTYFALYALQHRGQESAGIAVSDGQKILVYKDMGLVSQVFNESNLASLHGDIAIGHTRYSTSGSSVWENAQPTFRSTAMGSIALAHNGNLTNTGDLAQLVEKAQAESGEIAFDRRPLRSTSDTDLVTALLASHPDRSLEHAAVEVLKQVEGAFSFVFMDETTLYAARDRYGVRPLALGKLEHGWVVASETAALDIVGASYVREIEPGELLAIDEFGPRSVMFAEPESEVLRLRVRLPGATRLEPRRSQRARHSGRARSATRTRSARRSRPRDAHARQRHAGRDRIRRRVRNPLRRRACQECLRRPHVHPAVANVAPARYPAEAQSAARRHPRQAARRRRRLDRARQYAARGRAHVARSRCDRGAHSHLVAAGEVAVFLRHRLRDAGRVDRERS